MSRLDIVRIGVLGCGYWGPNHIRNLLSLQHLGTDVVAAADPDVGRRRYVSDRYPYVDVVANSGEVIENPDIDAVIIATPLSTHYEQARRALEAGKHVLVEKPFTTSLLEAVDLDRIANEHDRVLMVGHTFEYAEAVNYIRDTVDRGELGELTYIRSLRLNLGLFRDDTSVLWDLAPHDLSILMYVLERFPRSVQATGRARINPNVEDIANITLDFDDQLMANVTVSWIDAQKIRQMTLVGDRKMLVYDDVSPNEKIRIFDKGIDAPRRYDSFGDFPYAYRYGDIFSPMLHEREPLLAECQHFVECCQLGKRPRTGASSGAAVTAIIEAAEESIRRRGAPVALEAFGDDAPFAEWRSGAARSTNPPMAAHWTPPPQTTDVGAGPASTPAAARPKAMVIAPDDSERAFIAGVLASFEPGFEVVTVPSFEQAADWRDTFVPDLLIINEAVDQSEADNFVTDVLATPLGRHCRVVTIKNSSQGPLEFSRWSHVRLNEGASLSDWLELVRHVARQSDKPWG